MIKVILLKDAEAGRGVCFAKAVVENNGFSIDIAVGYIKKDKAAVVSKGTTVMELPDTMKVGTHVQYFTPEGEEEVREVTYIKIG